jgi:7-cyano-7-deazaguanine synthase
VLASGGVDSAALAVDLAGRSATVFPIFVRFGLRWEDAELAGLRAFLGAVAHPRVAPVTVLDEPVAEVYGPDHWSVGGAAVPGLDSPDEAVYLPGRNLLLATKAAVWCRVRGVDRLALGSLAGNPFPDSSAEFFDALADVLGRGLDGRLEILRPYAGLAKADVLRRLPGLPWHLTFSCLAPDGRGRHCGACNKCAERIRAFRAAGAADPTDYANPPRPT